MSYSENYRARAAHARQMAAESDGVVREEWLKLALMFDDMAMAGKAERPKALDGPTSNANAKNGYAHP